MTRLNEHHVLPHPKGGWDVKRSNSQRASLHCSTQKEAIDAARAISLHQRTELVIHGRDGHILRKNSHGHDSFPPRG